MADPPPTSPRTRTTTAAKRVLLPKALRECRPLAITFSVGVDGARAAADHLGGLRGASSYGRGEREPSRLACGDRHAERDRIRAIPLGPERVRGGGGDERAPRRDGDDRAARPRLDEVGGDGDRPKRRGGGRGP